MGIGVSLVLATVTDLLYDLAIAGLGAITYIVYTASALTLSAASLAIDVGLAVVPYALSALPFLIQAAPALAISYFVYNNPILTAAFIFSALAVGGATVAASSLASTTPGPGPTNPNNGLKSPEEQQQEFNDILSNINERLELKREIALYDETIANERFTSVTGDIVKNTFSNQALDSILYLLQKRDIIANGAKSFVETSSNFISSTFRSTSAATSSFDPPPPYDFTLEDFEQRNKTKGRQRSKAGQSNLETCGVTIDDFLYNLALCKAKGKPCPYYGYPVRRVGRRNNSKRKVRVSNRKRVHSSVRSNVRKGRPKRKNGPNSSSTVRKVTKRGRVGKSKSTVQRKRKK